MLAMGVLASGAWADDLRSVGVAATRSVSELIEAFRDDGVRGNAMRAAREIDRLDEPPIAMLQAALDSDDWQQRQYVANLLWSFAEPPPWVDRKPAGRVTRRLLEVTVEGLARDEWRAADGGRAEFSIRNAALGFRRLSVHAHAARDLLDDGLRSKDSQQRFLCALALGYGGVSESAEPAARVLLPHLRDNRIPEDAKWSVAAIYGFGPVVRPQLMRALGDADMQQADLLLLLLSDLEDPPETAKELEDRSRFNKVTRLVHDPAVEQQADRSMWWLRYLPE